MSQPEGFAVGNALEVREAIATLNGGGPEDVLNVCDELGSALGVSVVREAITSGAAFEKLKEIGRAHV